MQRNRPSGSLQLLKNSLKFPLGRPISERYNRYVKWRLNRAFKRGKDESLQFYSKKSRAIVMSGDTGKVRFTDDWNVPYFESSQIIVRNCGLTLTAFDTLSLAHDGIPDGLPRERVIGRSFAGIVEYIPDSIKKDKKRNRMCGLTEGDRVWGITNPLINISGNPEANYVYSQGTAADYIAINPWQCELAPVHIPLPHCAMLAYDMALLGCLINEFSFRLSDLLGSSALILGSGQQSFLSMASILCRMANSRNVTVVVNSRRHIDCVRALGVAHIICLENEDGSVNNVNYMDQLGKYELVFDSLAMTQSEIQRHMALVCPGVGHYVSCMAPLEQFLMANQVTQQEKFGTSAFDREFADLQRVRPDLASMMGDHQRSNNDAFEGVPEGSSDEEDHKTDPNSTYSESTGESEQQRTRREAMERRVHRLHQLEHGLSSAMSSMKNSITGEIDDSMESTEGGKKIKEDAFEKGLRNHGLKETEKLMKDWRQTIGEMGKMKFGIHTHLLHLLLDALGTQVQYGGLASAMENKRKESRIIVDRVYDLDRLISDKGFEYFLLNDRLLLGENIYVNIADEPEFTLPMYDEGLGIPFPQSKVYMLPDIQEYQQSWAKLVHSQGGIMLDQVSKEDPRLKTEEEQYMEDILDQSEGSNLNDQTDQFEERRLKSFP